MIPFLAINTKAPYFNLHLSGLGMMYGGGGDFTSNIDKMGGEGTAEFASRAIEIYCR